MGIMSGPSSTSSDDTDSGTSDYDGRALNTYNLGVINGREVTVLSSWEPGDPDR